MNWSIENPNVGVDHGVLPKMWLWTMVVSGLVPSNLSHRSAGFLLTNIEPWWSYWFLALNRLLWALGTSEKHKPSWFMDPEGLIETFCIPEQKIWTHVKYLEKYKYQINVTQTMDYLGYDSLYHKNMTGDSLFEKMEAFYKIPYNQKTFFNSPAIAQIPPPSSYLTTKELALSLSLLWVDASHFLLKDLWRQTYSS